MAMNFKPINAYILLFLLLIACKRKENTVLEQIYLTNFFHGERIIIDSLFLSGELLPDKKEFFFVIEGLPNHTEPVRFKIENIQKIDSRLKVQLDPFQKVLGGGLFNNGDNDFFFYQILCKKSG